MCYIMDLVGEEAGQCCRYAVILIWISDMFPINRVVLVTMRAFIFLFFGYHIHLPVQANQQFGESLFSATLLIEIFAPLGGPGTDCVQAGLVLRHEATLF